MNRQIFINLATKNLTEAKNFFSEIGFKFNPQFSNDDGCCLVIADNISVMLLTENHFKNFTDKSICDSKSSAESLLCITCESRDEVDNLVAKAHYAEMYRNTVTRKDSIILTKRALVVTKVENDSLYMHGKKIQVTGPPENRIIKAFKNVRFYKTDMSGKCDSLHSSNKSGLTQLIGKPVIWNFDNQMTGDIIHLIGNNKTEKLDSLKVFALFVEVLLLSQ